MPRQQVWMSTAQATLLEMLAAICVHHFARWTIDSLHSTAIMQETQGMLGLQDDTDLQHRQFYLKELPRTLACAVATNPLRYWWQMWLEKMLPTRPRGAHSAADGQQQKQSSETDAAEEKIIKEWIAQGRIKRSSVSWMNTFAKWILDLSLGNVWQSVVNALLERIVLFKGPSELFTGLAQETAVNMVGCFLSPAPLVSLLAFIIVPAYKRVVFEDAMSLVWVIFLGTFCGVVLPWFLSLEAVQEGIRNAANASSIANATATLEGHANLEL